MEGMSWTTRGDLTLSEELLAKADRSRLSASTAAGFLECPARTAAEKALPWKSNSLGAAELGTAAHSTLELLYEQKPKRRTREKARSLVDEVYWRSAEGHKESDTKQDVKLLEGTPDEVANLRRTWTSEVWKRVRGIWEIEDPTKIVVIRNEWAINIPPKPWVDLESPEAQAAVEAEWVEINGVPFTGYIDRASWVPANDRHDEGILVTDYKAGNITKHNPRWTDSHGEQLRLYYLALEAMGEQVVAAEVSYVRHGSRREIDVSESDLEKTEERFAQAWTNLRTSVADNRFTARASGLCPWCPLVASCPTAREAGRAVSESVNGDKILLPTIRRKARGENTKPTAAGFAARTPGGEAPVAIPFGEPVPAPEPANDFGSSGDDHGEIVTPSDHDGVRAGDEQSSQDTPAAPNTLHPPMVDGDDYNDHLGREIGVGDMESKPWEQTNDDGSLNPNSYAAQGLSGLVAKSMKLLIANGQTVNKNSILAVAQTFSTIIEEAQIDLTGSANLNSGANTRIRGMLFATMEAFPPPFATTIPPVGRAKKSKMEVYGEQVDASFDHDAAWGDWVDTMVRRVTMLYQTMNDLFDIELPDGPWEYLMPTEDEMSDIAPIRKTAAKKAADSDASDDDKNDDPDNGSENDED